MTTHTFVYRQRVVSFSVSGSGHPLLFLHGWGSSAAVMQTMVPAYEKQFLCVTLDFPGFGASEEPESAWTIDDYADLVEQLAARENWLKPHLICHSFGGRVALKLLAKPGASLRFGKVLITGGAGMKPIRKPSFYIKKYTAKFLKAPFEVLPEPLKSKGLTWVRTTALWKKLGSSDYSKLSGVMRETFVKSVSEYLENCLPAIKNEVFLLWGKDDDATPVYQAKRMEAGINGAALVVLDNAGHYAFLDQPQPFNAIALAFLNG